MNKKHIKIALRNVCYQNDALVEQVNQMREALKLAQINAIEDDKTIEDLREKLALERECCLNLHADWVRLHKDRHELLHKLSTRPVRPV